MNKKIENIVAKYQPINTKDKVIEMFHDFWLNNVNRKDLEYGSLKEFINGEALTPILNGAKLWLKRKGRSPFISTPMGGMNR